MEPIADNEGCLSERVRPSGAVNRGTRYEAYEAAWSGETDTVAQMLATGVDVNCQFIGYGGVSLLHCAAHCGHVELCKYLLAAGARIDITDDEGYTPLHCACNKGRLEIVRVLLGAKADISVRGGREKLTPLHEAYTSGSPETIQLLLDAGADPQALSADGSPPFHAMCNGGRPEMVEWLLKTRPPNANFRDLHGNTPLHIVCYDSHSDFLDMFVLHAKECDKQYPLCPKAFLDDRRRIVAMLLAAGADPLSKNNENELPGDLTDDAVVIRLLRPPPKAARD